MTSVPYVFVNGTTADGTQVNSDFNTVCAAIDSNYTTLAASIAALPPPGPTRVIYVAKVSSPYSLVVAATETRCRVKGWGGGGGSGAQNSSTVAGGGGGGGGFFDDYITGLTPGTITVTIGGGGTAGTGTGAGGNGGNTTFGSYATANGGTGGGGNNGAGFGSVAAGGTAVINTGSGLALSGGSGAGGIQVFEPGPVTVCRVGGAGGYSPFGGPAPPMSSMSAWGGSYPGGGAYGCPGAAGASNGALGADGLVIIEMFP